MSDTMIAPPAEAPTAPAPSAPAAPAAPAPNSAVQSAWFREFIREDGSLNHSALDRAPDHVKPITETWKKAKSFEDIAVQHVNSNFLNGKKALAPLPADAPAAAQQERKTLLDSLNGVPADIKGYGLTKPEGFPDNQWSQPLADNFAKWCHDNSVSPTAAKKMITLQAEGVKAQVAESEAYATDYRAKQQQAFEAQIRGENISADKASALVDKGVIALGLDPASPETQQLLKDSAMVRMMALRHAMAIGEDVTVTTNGGNTVQADPGAQAKDIQSNPANPLYAAYWNKDSKFSRSANQAAVEKVNELMRLSTAKPAGGARR